MFRNLKCLVIDEADRILEVQLYQIICTIHCTVVVAKDLSFDIIACPLYSVQCTCNYIK